MIDDLNQSQLLSVPEVSRILGMSKSSVCNHKRELGGIKIFGRLKFFREQIDAYLQAKWKEAEAMVLSSNARGANLQTELRHCQRSQKRGSPVIGGITDTDDPHNIFSDCE